MIVSLLAWVLVSDALAADPCAGLSLGDGVVTTGLSLPAASPGGDPAACVDEVGKRLAAMPGLRTVTVTAKVPDGARADGSATAAATAYVGRLVGAGLSAGRVSSVVAAGDAPGVIVISYAERTGTADVGTVTSASGEVRVGASVTALAPITSGNALPAETWVQTGTSGTAVLDLADGSRVRVRPNTQLQVGKLTLDENLQRVVLIDVQRGGIDTEVKAAAAGSSFQVRTAYGTAGVRGTIFRISADDEARLETLEGLVVLEGSAGTVEVAAGKGSRVGPDGMPSAPVDLADGPRVIAPEEGPLPSGGLKWQKAKGAQGYLVEVAADAEFVIDVSSYEVDKPGLSPDVAAGRWFWRVAVIDSQRFIGEWSKVYGFDAE